MKAHLMAKDGDFELQQALPQNEQALVQDLELNILFNAMAFGDPFLLKVAKQSILSSLDNLETILYRQNALKDCLRNPGIIREIYALAVEAIRSEKKMVRGVLSNSPTPTLHRSLEVLQMFADMLKKLRKIADTHADKFDSESFRVFFEMLIKELDEAYFASIQEHLRQLKFPGGVLISAALGKGNKGINYVLRMPESQPRWIQTIFTQKPPSYTFSIADRDLSGAQALAELQERGINLVANALAQANDHILSFFNMLQTELAFYIGCLNLHEQLAQIDAPVVFPLPVAASERKHAFSGLYDVSLALSLQQKVVGNDGNADGKALVIITGANQGGKSTFLRSIGLSQLMMQCGMFVPAEFYCSNLCMGLFTHYKREEDTEMNSGKLDEELNRMSAIADQLTSNSMVLFNESFAATNEREGSEIARQIISALIDVGIKVFFVTHLYEFPHALYAKQMDIAFFLRAERQPDGRRTYRVMEGEPLQTSYGTDVYHEVFEKRN